MVIVSAENNYTSIWIGKPQYDESLTEVNLVLLSIEPSTLTVNITKGYIGYTGVKVSILNQNIFREVARISHTTTRGDPEFNRYIEALNRDIIEPYQIPLGSVTDEQSKQVLAVYYPWYGAVDDRGIGDTLMGIQSSSRLTIHLLGLTIQWTKIWSGSILN